MNFQSQTGLTNSTNFYFYSSYFSSRDVLISRIDIFFENTSNSKFKTFEGTQNI